MPLYEYDCGQCGTFTELQSMSSSADPMACPDCGGLSERAVCTPFIANMDPHNRIAHQRNEKSANEPMVSSGLPPGKPHGHGHGHGHSHGHSHGHGKQRGLGSGLQHSHGRPWAMGH